MSSTDHQDDSDIIFLKRSDEKAGRVTPVILPPFQIQANMESGDHNGNTEKVVDVGSSSRTKSSSHNHKNMDNDDIITVHRTEVGDCDVTSLHLNGKSTKVEYDPNNILSPAHDSSKSSSIRSDSQHVTISEANADENISIIRSDNILVDVKAFRVTPSPDILPSLSEVSFTSDADKSGRKLVNLGRHLDHTPSPPCSQKDKDDGVIHLQREARSPHIVVSESVKPKSFPKNVVLPDTHPSVDDADNLFAPRSRSRTSSCDSGSGRDRSSSVNSGGFDEDDGVIRMNRSSENAHILVTPQVLAGVATMVTTPKRLIPARRASASAVPSPYCANKDSTSAHDADVIDFGASHSSSSGTGPSGSENNIKVHREDACECEHLHLKNSKVGESTPLVEQPLRKMPRKKRWSYTDISSIGSDPSSGGLPPQSPPSVSSLTLPKSVLSALGFGRKSSTETAAAPATAKARPRRLSWTGFGEPPATSASVEVPKPPETSTTATAVPMVVKSKPRRLSWTSPIGGQTNTSSSSSATTSSNSTAATGGVHEQKTHAEGNSHQEDVIVLRRSEVSPHAHSHAHAHAHAHAHGHGHVVDTPKDKSKT